MHPRDRGTVESAGWTPEPASAEGLESYLADDPSSVFDGSLGFSYPVERLMPRHADVGSHVFPSLTEAIDRFAPADFRPLDICIVTPDIAGPIANGGIGTAYWHVAHFLVEAGHKVTVLYTLGQHTENEPIERWVSHFSEQGINFVPLPDTDIPPAKGIFSQRLYRARATHEWLSRQNFDIVHGTEWMGALYYALAAKRLGLAYAQTVFLVKTSSPLLWNMAGNGQPISQPEEMIRAYTERKSVEYADYVIAPSHHMLRWMMRRGYDLPKDRCFVNPNIILTPSPSKPDDPLRRVPVKEFVFFGRLDARKGFPHFVRALNLANEMLSERNISVTFLGKWGVPHDAYKALIDDNKATWTFDWRVSEGKSSSEAVDYMKGDGRVAVIPSLLDNSPFTIFECLSERIPFITSDRGGGKELILPQDRPDVTFKPTPANIFTAMQNCADHGAIIARPAFDLQENLDLWRRAHAAFGSKATKTASADIALNGNWNGEIPCRSAGETPLVSVCVAHFQRPHLLREALWSLTHQTYPNIEVIVVDDGSDAAFQTDLDETVAAFAGQLDIRLIRQENKYLGAVRNTGWRASRGTFVLFMDDDNLAKPDEVDVFLTAAQVSGADILTAFSDSFRETPAPGVWPVAEERVTLLGDDVSLGIFLNCYGDSNCFVRRDTLERLGGFTEDYGVGLDDQEFFSRAVLNGFKLRIVPEALFFYRLSETRLRSRHFGAQYGRMRVLSAYLDRVPLALHAGLSFAAGQMTETARLRRERDERDREIERLADELGVARSLRAALYRIALAPASFAARTGRRIGGLFRITAGR